MKSDARRTGGWRRVRDCYYARVRLGPGKRPEYRMTGVSDDATAGTRAAQIGHVAELLIAARRGYDIKDFAKNIGACTSDKQGHIFVLAAKRLCEQAAPLSYADVTFEQFALRWTSGQLHLDYPDHVAKKQHAGDMNILKNRIVGIVGPIPLVMFTCDDADRVMRELPPPPAISRAYRRAVAQVVHRVLSLAVYPAKVLKSNPLPRGWLPKLGTPKAKSFLYPREEAKLLAKTDLDVRYRFLFGFLAREGMRKSEARLATWDDFDLENGTVTLDENKTKVPRSWPLDAGVVRALQIWKRAMGGTGPFDGLATAHLGERLRDELLAVGVARPQLYVESDKRMHLRAHDLRSTFVTLSLASGQTENWVARRTGHRSSTMIARYTVAAANARELGLGPLEPLDTAIPELARETAMQLHLGISSANELKRRGGEQGRKTQAANRAKAGRRSNGRTMGEHDTKGGVGAGLTPSRETGLVAPAGLEPARPYRARDFKSARDVSTGGDLRDSRRIRDSSGPVEGAITQTFTHSAEGGGDGSAGGDRTTDVRGPGPARAGAGLTGVSVQLSDGRVVRTDVEDGEPLEHVEARLKLAVGQRGGLR